MQSSGAAPVHGPVHGDDAIDPLVWAELVELLEDEPDDVLGDMIDSYLEDAAAQLAIIQAATDRRDAIALRRAVHALRSPSASLGATGLAGICGELETILRDDAEVTAWPPAGIIPLLAETERAMASLRSRHPRHGSQP